jgi:uncharacterized repeat protein (TIGR01451 family)
MEKFRAHPRTVLLAAGLLLSTQALADPLIINEFRVRGPNGANDEYIEIYNPGPTDHTVAAVSGTGYGVAASDGVTRISIPNGTVIPAGGHYLGVNSVGYSLASYPAGNGTTATGDATYTTDIPDNAGIALFNNNTGGASYSLANRMDAVGSTSEANTLYKEGTGYPALTPFSIDYAFHRDECGKDGSITTFGACPSPGQPTDSDNNAADFVFVDTNGTSAGAGQRLGAPGPENLSGPITFGTGLTGAMLDSCVGGEPPNQVRDFTSDPANNSTFGTLDLRHTFTNNTGAPLTRLRFRIVDLTTFPAPSGIADLRPRTSTSVVVTVDREPCGSGTSNVTVQGTTLEQPPSQPNGSGFNGSLSVPTVTLGTPLANGASVDVRFLLGIQQTGAFKFGIVPEGLPEAGLDGGMLLVECTFTDGACVIPTDADLSIVKSDSPDPVVVGQPLTYTLFVSNAGPDDAANVVVSDTLPAGVDFQSAVASQGSCLFAAPTVTCDLGSISNGGDATVTIVVTPQSAGMISNTATVASDATDLDQSNNSDTEGSEVDPGEADLAITKTSSANPATLGVPFQYTLTIVNHGPQDATSVEVVDALPGNVTYGSATPSQGSCLENAGVVTCQLGTIPNQGSATVVIEVTPTAAGGLTNTATVSSAVSDPDPSDSSATVVVEVGLGGASFTVTKDFTDDNPAEVLVSISCNTGLPLQQSFHISEAGGVKFVVTQFVSGAMDCAITEEVPDGYLPEYFDGNASSLNGCTFEDIAGDADLSCRITNSPAPVDIEIEKLWVFEGDGGGIDSRYELTLECNAEIVGDDVFSDDVSRVFTAQVIPGYPSSTCSVQEQVFDGAVEIDNGCQEIVISAGHGASCNITNTVFFEGIPTLDRHGLAVLALLVLGLGLVGVRRLAG